jgi:hypothetical protein
MPIQIDFSQQSIYRRIGAADLFFGDCFRTTLSQLVLMLSWDNKMPASSTFLYDTVTSQLGQHLANRAVSGATYCLRRLLKS